eukprot:439768-Prymnesium_polylepis.1
MYPRLSPSSSQPVNKLEVELGEAKAEIALLQVQLKASEDKRNKLQVDLQIAKAELGDAVWNISQRSRKERALKELVEKLAEKQRQREREEELAEALRMCRQK